MSDTKTVAPRDTTSAKASGNTSGLSVALFPMVIIAMTIERMSVVWEERGATDAPSDKIQTEIVWNAERLDYSIGVRREVGNAFVEEGVFVSIARTF